MSTQEQRERFEAVQRPRTDLAKNRRGDYTNPVVQHCWRTWQTAEAAAIERCAKVCNEVAEEFGPGDLKNASLQCSATIRALLPKEE